MTLLVATTNPGKLAELRSLLTDTGIDIVSLHDVDSVPAVVEDADSFEGNAIKKAREVAMATRLHTLADDSGLCVDALDGAPGVRSARYAGDDADDTMNNQKLIRALGFVPEGRRSAHFVCVLAISAPDGTMVRTEEGRLEGRIVETPRGHHGFGYDPLFIPRGHAATLGELGADYKRQHSHRAVAMRCMRDFLMSTKLG